MRVVPPGHQPDEDDTGGELVASPSPAPAEQRVRDPGVAEFDVLADVPGGKGDLSAVAAVPHRQLAQ